MPDVNERGQRAVIVRRLKESAAVKERLAAEQAESIAGAARLVRAALDAGGTLFLFGNGGSAADAQHIAAELVGRYGRARPGLAALALTTDTSFLTAWSNDESFEGVFARQVESLGRPGDVVLALSTSGTSANVIAGVAAAKRVGMATIALTGQSGGRLREMVDVCISVPSAETPRIQEAHIAIGHILCELVEAEGADAAE